jgi:glycogen debranching enzyme
MQYEGFNINLKLDKTDGIIYGGNAYNCLTWMDKMGSSHKAGNLGTPATSRDGAPIEMTCLLKKCLSIVGDW